MTLMCSIRSQTEVQGCAYLILFQNGQTTVVTVGQLLSEDLK